MNKQIPAIILAIACAVLAVALYNSNMETAGLKEKVAALASVQKQSAAADPGPIEETPVEMVQADNPAVNRPEEAAAPAGDPASSGEEKTASHRMMSSMARMMENPTMNKVMEASQRGAIGALYSDLIEYLDLNAEETGYFMDLLMYRQMKQMDLGMKMMSGDMDAESKKAMVDELKEADETVKTEMEKFLNNPDDFAEFEFYEKTMEERMMLSQMDQKLAESNTELSDETYRTLLGMMHDEKNSYDFTSDLHDEKNMDLSPERFSGENLENYANDMDELNRIVIGKAQTLLTPEQLSAFEEAIRIFTEMQKAQIEMVGQMFGGGKKSTAP